MRVLEQLVRFIYRRWVLISSICLIVISVGSLVPLAELPLLPGTDKSHHLLGYAALALPVALRGNRYWLLLIVAAFAWSGAIEVIQPYVNRYGEWPDLLANGAGLFIGVLVGIGVRKFIRE